MINVGIDWAEAHHDVYVEDDEGDELAKGRVPDGIEGVERIHEMLSAHADDPAQVAIGIELDRGLLVEALVAAGYEVHAVNPLAVSRYRDRLAPAGAKSDPGDARVLAEVMRTDRHLHREVAGDSSQAEAIKVLARAHQNLIWTRQRIGNQLRSVLREFYPGALRTLSDLASADAIAVLGIAPTPTTARALTKAKVRRALASGGRKRRLDDRASEIVEALRAPQLGAPALVEEAFGHQVASLVAVLRTLAAQIEELRAEVERSFEGHPDAEIITSLPGLSSVLGARVLAEFGDDRTRYADARARRCYGGHRADHEGLWHAQSRARQGGAQQTPRRCVLRMGVLLAARLTGSPGLLRPPASLGQDPQPSTQGAREPLGRDPPRMSRTPRAIPRGSRLEERPQDRCLTRPARGMSSSPRNRSRTSARGRASSTPGRR
jgi:hypothetical protein